MGLGTKIKEALHGDSHNRHTDETKPPGAFPSEAEFSRTWSEGNDYEVPETRKTGAKAQTSGTAPTTAGNNNLTSTASQRQKLRKDVDDWDSTPNRYSKSAISDLSDDSGVELDQAKKARTSTGGYWGDLSPGHKTSTNNKDLPERPRVADGSPNTTSPPRDSHPRGDQAVGGGVYNSVTGAGSQQHPVLREGDVVYDPLTSGTKGTHIHSGIGHDSKMEPRVAGRGIANNDHKGYGLAGAGAAVGAGAAAGYGAHEYGRRGQDEFNHDRSSPSTGYNGNNYSTSDRYQTYGLNSDNGNQGIHQPTPNRNFGNGVPRSSMLDPEEPFNAHHTAAQNKAINHPQESSPVSSGSPAGVGSVRASSDGGLNSMGKNHFGPGHEGAKVLHTCQHCGRDNDISQYFRKDVVYRLGS